MKPLLPKEHTASRSLTLNRDRRAVYDVVRDVANAPQWREGVKKIEMLGNNQFREHSKMGTVTYAIDEDDPGRKLVTRIVDRNLGYSGSWTYTFADAPGGSVITITENGEVSNLFFRVMSRFVFGYTATIDRYLTALQKRLA